MRKTRGGGGTVVTSVSDEDSSVISDVNPDELARMLEVQVYAFHLNVNLY